MIRNPKIVVIIWMCLLAITLAGVVTALIVVKPTHKLNCDKAYDLFGQNFGRYYIYMEFNDNKKMYKYRSDTLAIVRGEPRCFPASIIVTAYQNK